MTDFKSEMRELTNELLVDYGDECFKHQHRDIINKFSSSLLALISKKLPKEKCFFKRDFIGVKGLTHYDEAKLREQAFNDCLSEIKEKLGITHIV